MQTKTQNQIQKQTSKQQKKKVIIHNADEISYIGFSVSQCEENIRRTVEANKHQNIPNSKSINNIINKLQYFHKQCKTYVNKVMKGIATKEDYVIYATAYVMLAKADDTIKSLN